MIGENASTGGQDPIGAGAGENDPIVVEVIVGGVRQLEIHFPVTLPEGARPEGAEPIWGSVAFGTEAVRELRDVCNQFLGENHGNS